MTDLPKGYDPNNPTWSCVACMNKKPTSRPVGKDVVPVKMSRLTQVAQERFRLRNPDGNPAGTGDGEVGLCTKHRAEFLVS